MGNYGVLRYDADSSLDSSFGSEGFRQIDLGGNDEARAVGVLPSGRIAVVGYTSGDLGLILLESDGELCTVRCAPASGIHTDFAGNESAYTLMLQPDGKILVAGGGNGDDPPSGSRFYAARYYYGGLLNQRSYRLDPSFGDDGTVATNVMERASARAIVIDADNNILVAGYGHNGSDYDFALLRLIGPKAQPPAFASSTPPREAQVGTAYSLAFAASGYPPPLYGVSAGRLPPGLALEATTGQLSGTPTEPRCVRFLDPCVQWGRHRNPGDDRPGNSPTFSAGAAKIARA